MDRDEHYVEEGEWDDPALRALITAARAAGRDQMADQLQVEYDEHAAAQGERIEHALDVPTRIDWDRWSTEDVNRALLSLWERVELGPDLLPTRAIWRIEEWRRDGL